MAKEVSRIFDKISKLEIVYFEDKFGAKSQVQHPLSLTRDQRNAIEADHLATLEANEQAFEQLSGE